MSKPYTKDSRHVLTKDPPALGYAALNRQAMSQSDILRYIFETIKDFEDLERYEDMPIFTRYENDYEPIEKLAGKLVPTRTLKLLTRYLNEYETALESAKVNLFSVLKSKFDKNIELTRFDPQLVCDVYSSIILYLRGNNFGDQPYHRDSKNEYFYQDNLKQLLVEEVGLPSPIISIVVQDLFDIGLLYVDSNQYTWNQKITFNAPLFDLWIGELTPRFFEDRPWLVNRFNELELKAFISSKYHTSNAGFVYLAKASTGHYKIGYSKHPDIRVQQINSGKTALPIKVELIHSFLAEDAPKAESELHAHFSSKHFRGEWFLLDTEDVDLVMSLNGYTLTEGFRYQAKDKDLLDEWNGLVQDFEAAALYFENFNKGAYSNLNTLVKNGYRAKVA